MVATTRTSRRKPLAHAASSTATGTATSTSGSRDITALPSTSLDSATRSGRAPVVRVPPPSGVHSTPAKARLHAPRTRTTSMTTRDSPQSTCSAVSAESSRHSSGKLRAEFCATGTGLRRILFEPDSDHTIEHRRKQLAVFVASNPSCIQACAITVDLDDGPVVLSVPDACNPVLVQAVTEAASAQSAVDVEVDFDQCGKRTLLAVTVPASRHRK